MAKKFIFTTFSFSNTLILVLLCCIIYFFTLAITRNEIIMSFFSYLFTFFIEPLKLLFEVVFFYAYKFTGNVGVSIVIISLVINILVLPLYKRADKLEKEQGGQD